MSALKNLWLVVALVVAMVIYGNVGDVRAAYEASPGAGTIDPCIAVSFSAFTPPPFSQDKNNTEVAPKSEFSFFASKEALPNSIKVTVKGEAVPLTVKPQQNGSLVSGKLPAGVKGAFIRVEISAKGPAQCDRVDGWLLKVGN